MKHLVPVLALLLACHSGEDQTPTSAQNQTAQNQTPTSAAKDQTSPAEEKAAYFRDVDRFCYAEKHAGALEIETAARGMVVADWLARNLETQRARDFLASLHTKKPAEKGPLLLEQSTLAKLDGCPTADAWTRVSRAQPSAPQP